MNKIGVVHIVTKCIEIGMNESKMGWNEQQHFEINGYSYTFSVNRLERMHKWKGGGRVMSLRMEILLCKNPAVAEKCIQHVCIPNRVYEYQ